jgi:antitoxin ParD1/3/4
MKHNTSIAVGTHFDSFMQNQVETGRYASKSEVIRAGLRLLEQEEEKLKTLRQALAEGEQSGFVENFDSQQFINALKRKLVS